MAEYILEENGDGSMELSFYICSLAGIFLLGVLIGSGVL